MYSNLSVLYGETLSEASMSYRLIGRFPLCEKQQFYAHAKIHELTYTLSSTAS